MSVIRVRGLRHRYPDGTQALEGIDFHLEAGECVAVFGANGSGKTTFVLHLNGLLEGEGSIEVCGIPVTERQFDKVRAKLGLVFQDSDEQLFMPTVLEDVAFGPLNRGPARIRRWRAQRRSKRAGMGASIGKSSVSFEQRRKETRGDCRRAGDGPGNSGSGRADHVLGSAGRSAN